MARSRTLILLAVLLAAAGGAVWYLHDRTPPTPLEVLRKKVKANPGDTASRIAFLTLLLDTAEKESLSAAKDDVKLLAAGDIVSPRFQTQTAAIMARRAVVAAMNNEAAAVISAGLSQSPANLDLVLLAVRYYKNQGNWSRLKTVIDKAREVIPAAKDNTALSEGMIVACYFLHQMFEGNQEADRLIAVDKENPLAILALARVAQLRGDLATVDKTLDLLLSHAYPSDPFALAIYGGLLRDRDKLDQAKTAFVRASTFLPDLPDFHYLAAAVYRRMNNEAGATFEYTLIWRVNAEDPYVYVGRAETFHRQGNDADANKYLQIAAERAPNDARILQRNAEFLSSYTDNKTLAEARVYAERAAQASNNQDFEALRLLARICAKAKQFQDALYFSNLAHKAAEAYNARTAIREIADEMTYYRSNEIRTPQHYGDLDEPNATRPFPEDPAGTAPATAPATFTAPATSTAPATLPSTRP